MTTDNHWVTGMFHDRSSAERAVDALLKAGYRSDEVSLVMSDEARTRHFGGTNATGSDVAGRDGAGRDVTGHKVGGDASLNDPNTKGRLAEGVGVGGLVGGSVGAIVAGIAAVGTALVLPGIGLIVAGPIAAALAGAGAGSATGGLIGGLANAAGVPEPTARHYESGLKRGGMLVAAKARSAADVQQLRQWFDDAGADNIKG